MKAVIQRVSNASVSVCGKTKAQIEQGLLILLGVARQDGDGEAQRLASKTASLRIFGDKNEKMNLSLRDIKGQALVISNFTLCADNKKGHRPSFIGAKEPPEALRLYGLFCEALEKELGRTVGRGVFGGDMKVSLLNDGPVTIILDTDEFGRAKCSS